MVALHREGSAWALANSGAQKEIVFTVYTNAWKYYQVALELLVEYRDVCEQLQTADDGHSAEAREQAATSRGDE